MASIKIVLDPEKDGLGIPYKGKLHHMTDEDELVIMGLEGGMSSGQPSMAFAFGLPNGDLVVAETSWKLFATAHHQFKAKFGEPDFANMTLIGGKGETTVHLVESEKPFARCGNCGWHLEGENTEASAEHLVREWERHYKKKHPAIALPPRPKFPGLN